MLLIPARIRHLLEKGRVEGRDKANAEWEAWLLRYREAEAKDEESTNLRPASAPAPAMSPRIPKPFTASVPRPQALRYRRFRSRHN